MLEDDAEDPNVIIRDDYDADAEQNNTEADEYEVDDESPKITDAFDHVFVINCQHRPDRLKQFEDEMTDKGIGDMDKITVVNAIVGDYTSHPAGWDSGNGAWGCLQSHRRILEDLMHIRDERDDLDWESALILEDDVFFLPGALKKLDQCLEDIPPDWGQLYLGGQHRGTGGAKARKTESEHVLNGVSVNRTHAYAVSRQHIQEIYCHISFMPDYYSGCHVDHQLERAHQRKDWPTYCTGPQWICGQRASTSNISGKKLPDLVWQPKLKKARHK